MGSALYLPRLRIRRLLTVDSPQGIAFEFKLQYGSVGIVKVPVIPGLVSREFPFGQTESNRAFHRNMTAVGHDDFI